MESNQPHQRIQAINKCPMDLIDLENHIRTKYAKEDPKAVERSIDSIGVVNQDINHDFPRFVFYYSHPNTGEFKYITPIYSGFKEIKKEKLQQPLLHIKEGYVKWLQLIQGPNLSSGNLQEIVRADCDRAVEEFCTRIRLYEGSADSSFDVYSAFYHYIKNPKVRQEITAVLKKYNRTEEI